MNSAIDVARFLIFLKNNDHRGLSLSNLKLQKLLYYCQGYFLAMYNKPMFNDKIEAWKYGPVVRNVYNVYSEYGDLDITEEVDLDSLQLNDQKLSIIAYVWKELGELRPTTLVDKTHSETPWLKAWLNNERFRVIDLEAMRAYFSKNDPRYSIYMTLR